MPQNNRETFNAIIHSISVTSEVAVCKDGITVPLPNWEPHLEPVEEPYAQRPGVLIIPGGDLHGLAVNITVNNLAPGQRVTLSGQLDDVVFEGSLQVDKPGTPQTVVVLPRQEVKEFKWIYGDVEWRLETDGGETVPVGKTRMELSWIYGYPAGMFKKGVWIEVLRLIASFFEPGHTRRVSDYAKKEIIEKVIDYLHFETGLQYDCYRGANYYSENKYGGGFKLRAFLRAAFPLCNCYDLAGAVQIYLGALGIDDVTWILTEPYGYLNETSLVGRGQVNNPFYLMYDPPASPVTEISNKKRTGFGNHAFCVLAEEERETVLDACAGPHTGSDSKRHYSKECVDTNTCLYLDRTGLCTDPEAPAFSIQHPATPIDMRTYYGITDIHSAMPEDFWKDLEKKESDTIREFKKKIGFHAALRGISNTHGVVREWPDDPLSTMPFGLDIWKPEYVDHITGVKSVLKEWVYSRDHKGKKEYLKIEVRVYNKGIGEARDMLIRHALSTSMPDNPFQPAAQEDASGHLHLVDKNNQGKHNWVFHNVYFVVDGTLTTLPLPPVVVHLQLMAAPHIVAPLSQHLPKINKIAVSPKNKTIQVGDEIKVTIESGQPVEEIDDLLIDFFLDGGSLRLVRETILEKENKIQLTFRGIKPGCVNIQFVLAQKKTLLCSRARSVDVKVYKTLPPK